MDSFIKIVEQKKDEPVTTIHTQQIELLKKYVSQRKNVFICGSSGVGKTYILKSVLNEYNSLEIEKDHLKSKSHYMDFIRPAAKHAFIEDYDSDYKKVVEKVSDGDRVTRGSLVITSTNMCMFPNFETIFIPRHKPQKLLLLTDDRSPLVENAAIGCNGNIRDFFSYLEGSDTKDVFKTPKDYIKDVLSDPAPIGIPSSIHEHGHVWDIFQENYLDSHGVDVLRASSSFSLADVYDTYMYTNGDWSVMPYFILNSLSIPKNCLGKPLIRDKIRPGSCWTKYGNYKMRNQKVQEIISKNANNMSIEKLCLLQKYAEKGELSNLISYKITPQDFDVINHLCVGNKLKQRDVTKVKKALKNVYEGG
jgi:AAA+ ATPase superfamily predicted ATPase